MMSISPLDAARAAAIASKALLMRGMLAAVVVAGLVLTAAVLPAEYGIDPTGIGQAIGLKGLSSKADGNTKSATAQAVVDVDSLAHTQKTVVAKQKVAYRSDIREVFLAPGKGLEIKTHLAKGATLIYSWKTKDGEKISHDFHGDPVNAKNDEFESFIEEKNVSESNAALIAPFTGVHGWYWKNNGAAPVTILLQASGFYTDMFYPHGEPASK
jgi:hypothetical protein